MTTSVYRVSKDEGPINKLGELGWEIISKEGIVIGHAFDMPEDASILNQFVEWFGRRINASAEERKLLKQAGFPSVRYHEEKTGKRKYRLTEEAMANIRKWRIEFSYVDEIPLAYITFGPLDLNIPAFFDRAVIDKYVPEEIIAEAIACNAFSEGECEQEA